MKATGRFLLNARFDNQRDCRLDVNTLDQGPTERLAMNDIARIKLRLAQPLFVDAYEENRATGAFIVVDEATNNTVGAGIVD